MPFIRRFDLSFIRQKFIPDSDPETDDSNNSESGSDNSPGNSPGSSSGSSSGSGSSSSPSGSNGISYNSYKIYIYAGWTQEIFNEHYIYNLSGDLYVNNQSANNELINNLAPNQELPETAVKMSDYQMSLSRNIYIA